jgi:prevent-host-death family protein
MKSGKVRFNVAEAKAQFSSLVRRAVAGEDIVIARDGKPLVKLVSLSQPQQARKPGSAKGKIWMAPDFDETPADFKDYM